MLNNIFLERTFHPVGQGAFFSECFKADNGRKFNVVYDCGTKSPKDGLKHAISYTFSNGEQIDVIFISHLDQDHVNGVKELANNNNLTVRTLFVMPLFSMYSFVLAYIKFGSSFIQMFRTISKKGCKLLFVKPMEIEDDNEGDIIDISENRIDGEGQTITTIRGIPISGISIKSGTKFKYLDIWEYLPFNPSGADENLFQKEIIRKHLQLDLLLNALGKTKPTTGEIKELEKVKKIYKKVTHRVGRDSNKLNISSLVLLSHKPDHSIKIVSQPSFPWPWFVEFNLPYRCRNSEMSACLYTGDTDFSNSSVYQRLMTVVMKYQRGEQLLFLQIPHHGSKNNYCTDLCRDFSYVCAFTNFGVNYHQKIFDPQLIIEYWRQTRPLVLITEYPQTVFKTTISRY